MVGQVTWDMVANLSLFEAGSYGCTIEPINKNPVTQTIAPNAESSCTGGCYDKLSMLPQPGIRYTTSPTSGADGVTSNFRSDHPGGANFLFGDGSVHFLNEDIEMLTYQKLSTIKGEEVVEVPE